MLRTISAEFDSVNSAEIAAHALKSQISGINEITIKSTHKPSIDDKTSVMSLTGNLYPYNNGYFGSQAIIAFPFMNQLTESQDSYDRNKDLYTAIMSITCSNECAKEVISMLTSHGGLKIIE